MKFDGIQELHSTLKEIGLSDKEAHIYLTLLIIGSNPASTTAKRAEMNRGGCYAVLKRLLEKGFTHETIKGGVSYFTAVEPRYIIDRLKSRKDELDSKIRNMSQTIEQLETLRCDYPRRPKVVFYEGQAGVQNIMEDTLSSPEPIRAYASLNELVDLIPNYFPNYYKRRTQKGIRVKAIYPATRQSYHHKLRDEEELRQSRLVPPELDFHLDVLIYGNKVAITSLKEKFGVLIESKEMADAQKKIFDLLWISSKKYDEIMTKKMQAETEGSSSENLPA